jgi:hypothetical protein
MLITVGENVGFWEIIVFSDPATPGKCGNGDVLFCSSVDTAQLITASIHENTFT